MRTMNLPGEENRSRPPVTTMVEALRLRVERRGHARLYTFMESSETECSYEYIERMARMVAAHLQERGVAGEPVIVLQLPGLQYTISVLGCLFAGAIAVPARPPDPARLDRTLPPLLHIIQGCGARLMLTSTATRELLQRIGDAVSAPPSLAKPARVATDELDASAADAWRDPDLSGGDAALLQYTAGATLAPRGVVITHDNLTQSARALATCAGYQDGDTGVTWLSPYHAMGLIGTLLQPIYSDIPMVVVSPRVFHDQPLSWLELITRHRATCSAAPSFAYDRCVRHATPEALAKLDLGSWRVAFCGAEPISASTIRSFAETFAPAGFDASALVPCYGLAEATLLVSMRDRSRTSTPTARSVKKAGIEQGWMLDTTEGDTDPGELVASGPGLPVIDVRIVDPETRIEQFSHQIGEIWLSGPLVAKGYWDAPEETERTFRARLESGEGPFLRTGDLGCVLDGELYVLGRAMARITIAGRAHHAHDLEHTVERAHPALRPGAGACFSIEHEGGERLVVVHEAAPGELAHAQEICDAIQAHLEAEHQLSAHDVVLLAPRTAHRTLHGKVQRWACRDAYLENTLKDIARSRSASHGASPRA